MGQARNDRSFGYEMPPPLVHALVRGTTWCLHCRNCQREIAVDVVTLVEGVADVRHFDAAATFGRGRCRECGGQLKQTGGFQLRSLKNTGWMPRTIAGDGKALQRPFAALKPFSGAH